MRVLIVDDNEFIRLGLRSALESREQITEVVEAADGDAAIDICARTKIDVALVDVRLPGTDGVGVLARIVDRVTVLMLSHSDDRSVVDRALTLGASGYIVHGSLGSQGLWDAIRACLAGGMFISGVSASPGFAARRAAEHGLRLTPVRELLSPRERDVMDLIAEGLSNGEVAERLFLSQKTVKNHVNSIFAKLGVTTRGRAIRTWLVGAAPAPMEEEFPVRLRRTR